MSAVPLSRLRSLLRQIVRAPAVRAVLLQALAFPLTLLIVYLLARSGLPLVLAAVALLQGMVAAALSRLARLAPWWWLIQWLFPLALLSAHSFDMPPLLFLLAFLLLLGWYWSTFRTQVPFYPSGPAAWDAVLSLLPEQKPVRLIDIGSGLGGLVLHLARRRPDSDVIGIELAPLPWLLSRLRAVFAGSRAHFVRGDYDSLDFSQYDIVFAYLSPAAMLALWLKARTEMRPGAMLISYEFIIPGHSPDRILPEIAGGRSLYVWFF